MAARIRSIDYASTLSQVEIPTLVCAGRFDPQTTVEANAAVASSVPGARLVTFEASGHYPFVEEGRRFRAVVEVFLSERAS